MDYLTMKARREGPFGPEPWQDLDQDEMDEAAGRFMMACVKSQGRIESVAVVLEGGDVIRYRWAHSSTDT